MVNRNHLGVLSFSPALLGQGHEFAIGALGAGKTTLLRQVAAASARRTGERVKVLLTDEDRDHWGQARENQIFFADTPRLMAARLRGAGPNLVVAELPGVGANAIFTPEIRDALDERASWGFPFLVSARSAPKRILSLPGCVHLDVTHHDGLPDMHWVRRAGCEYLFAPAASRPVADTNQ